MAELFRSFMSYTMFWVPLLLSHASPVTHTYSNPQSQYAFHQYPESHEEPFNDTNSVTSSMVLQYPIVPPH